jgi:hypothetical protein
MGHPNPPRVLIVSSCPDPEIPQRHELEVGGLPAQLALPELLKNLMNGAAARGELPPLVIDTLHLPYRDLDYDADLLDQIVFTHRYDAALSHIVLNNGARVTDRFFEMLAHRALGPHGQLLNPVTCIRKTTLHAKSGVSAPSYDAMPCIIKLDRNFNRRDTLFLCRSQEALDTWRRETPEADQHAFVREPFHVDYKRAGGGVYRVERWLITFDDLTVECRLSDDFFVKAATSFRYQLRDIRRLEEDWCLLSTFGWDWRGQSVDCAYDEDKEAWNARYRVMKRVTQDFALHYGELDVIRTGRNEFTVIDVTSTGGVLVSSRYCLRLTQAMLVQRLRALATRSLDAKDQGE